ncbi:hypothetical protein E2C01_000196 [Portunus trituberculatus]|uniref:Uncharacterized protein n=1 Tax=Portunus trituberculatus TaxID=210409 RepID=A0A5B7CDG5_PORTR|nr:hypothetical protein [Portunus trituberculatus]
MLSFLNRVSSSCNVSVLGGLGCACGSSVTNYSPEKTCAIVLPAYRAFISYYVNCCVSHTIIFYHHRASTRRETLLFGGNSYRLDRSQRNVTCFSRASGRHIVARKKTTLR